MQIAAFDTDDLADGTGKAPITFIGKELLNTSKRMNPSYVKNEDGTYQEGTGAIGGWEKSEMRAYLKSDIKPLIPELVINRVAKVINEQNSYDVTGKYISQTTQDELWIVDSRSIVGANNKYKVVYFDNASRVKHKAGSNTAIRWWNRNAPHMSRFSSVSETGDTRDYVPNNNESMGICLGFCLRGPREIQDTWEEIFAAEADGTYKDKYQISDYKPLDLGSEGIINMQIAAFDTDDLADGSGKAPITWIGREPLKTVKGMSGYRWEISSVRTYLKDTIKPLIADNINKRILTVEKKQRSFADDNPYSVITTITEDDVWIPSKEEVVGTGCQYETLFPNNTSRIKGNRGWWLRTKGRSYEYELISKEGDASATTSSNSSQIVLCFCT